MAGACVVLKESRYLVEMGGSLTVRVQTEMCKDICI